MIKLELNRAKFIVEEFLQKEIGNLQDILGADHPYWVGNEEVTVGTIQTAIDILISKDVF